MLLTLLLSVIMMAAMFGLLYAAVGLIQNKKFFSTAPKDIRDAVTEHPERFRGARVLGWILAIVCLFLIVGVFVYGAFDGIKNGYSFSRFFLRFLVILYLWKAFDVVCFDWFLLTRSRFFQRFFPETEGCAGYHSFGFNLKGQVIRLIVFPFAAAALAGICVLIR